MRPIHWTISVPVLVAIVTGLAAFAGTIWTGYANTSLERHKFEYTMIETALNSSSKVEKAEQIQFLLDIGLLSGLNSGQLTRYANDKGELLPHSSAIRDKRITYIQAKIILNLLKDRTNTSFYIGKFDENDDLSFYIGLAKFQKAHNLRIDGLLGAETVLAMWEACSDCPRVLQPSLSKDSSAP